MRFLFPLVLLTACSTPSPAPVSLPVSSAPEAASPAPAAAAEAAGHGAGEHHHDSPHGGIVRPLGDGHVEALMMPGGVMFYVSDAAQRPVSLEGYSGTATVDGPDGVQTVALMSMGDHLHAPAKLTQGAPASVVLTLTKDGKADSASFETEAVGLQAHDHSALHGGVVSMWGDTHLEYAPGGDTYRIWVSDAHRVAITTGVSGMLKDGDTAVPLVFDPTTGMLSGAGAGAGTRPVMVDVKVGDTAFSLGFDAVATAGH
jgi:hypothetical protein